MKLKNFLNRIPRPVKASFYAVCVVLLAVCYYIALGCPALTLKQEMRRAEKAHLVGPSKIVDQVRYEQYSEFEKLLVGETEYGIVFFGRYYKSHPYDDPFAEKQHMLSYIEKTGDITVAAAPNIWGLHWEFHGFSRSLPVYIFTEDANAVRAQIVITVTQALQENPSRKSEITLSGSADRANDSFFRIMLEADTGNGLNALYCLSLTSGSSPHFTAVDNSVERITATVQLYGSNGQLISEETLTIYEKS